MRCNWQKKDWLNFQYQTTDIEEILFDFAQRTGRISVVLEGLSKIERTEAMKNSEIEWNT